MKNLIIVGAGGFGREMFAAALGAVGYGTEFAVGGFLDDNPRALDSFGGYPKVISSPREYEPSCNDVFITAVGSIQLRRDLVAAIESRGGVFVSVIHKTAFIGVNVKISSGSFIAPGVSLTSDISIGSHVCVFHNASVGNDTVIGDYSHVYAQCAIGGAVKIGTGVSIYPGAVVTPRRKVGDGAVIGALSAVFADVPPDMRVLGNPAVPLH